MTRLLFAPPSLVDISGYPPDHSFKSVKKSNLLLFSNLPTGLKISEENNVLFTSYMSLTS